MFTLGVYLKITEVAQSFGHQVTLIETNLHVNGLTPSINYLDFHARHTPGDI
jgi:hypothetical protein